MLFTSFILVCGLSLAAVSPQSAFHSGSGQLDFPRLGQQSATAASIGPFDVSSPDSTTSLRLQFAGQLRLQYENKDQGAGKARTDKLTMYARRIRTSAAVGLPRYKLEFKLQLSFAPESLELMDAYFDYGLSARANLRFGQFKVPFTRYRIESFQRLTFPDWAIVTKYFGAERQMGAAIHNGYEKSPKWGYAAGIFTGVNARASHGIGMAVLYGEEVPNPSDLADPGPKAEFHPEIFIYHSYNPQGMSIQSDSDDESKGFRFFAAASGAWDLDPTEYFDFTARLAPEVLIKYRGLSFGAIGYAGWAEMGKPSITKKAMLGALVQTSYRINKWYEVAVRYAIVDFDDAFVTNAYQRAQDIIAGARADVESSEEKELAEVNLADVLAQYKSIGKVTREQEATFGFNIYIDGNSLKLQNDAGWLFHTRVDGNRSDFVARSQFQLAF